MANIQAFLTNTLFFSLTLFSSLLHFTSSKPQGGFSLKLIPITHPESPAYLGSLNDYQRWQKFVQISKARLLRYESQLSSTKDSALNASKISLLGSQEGYYLVQVHLGTPTMAVYLTMDSGAGLIWTQCAPCVNCFPQRLPMFDSRTSKSFRLLPCTHPLCNGGPQSRFQCHHGQCIYEEHYPVADSHTRGRAATETFGFLRGGDKPIVFGCSDNNDNFPQFTNSDTSGVLGLGSSSESLIGQLGPEVDYRFSYCITPYNSAAMRISFLRFGNDIDKGGKTFQSTPFLPEVRTHYFVDVLDISVNGVRLGFEPGFLKAYGVPGAIVDSGAIISFIPGDAHDRVIKAFEDHYAPFGLIRAENDLGFALCYGDRDNFHNYASMTYHLRGGDIVVQPENAHYFNHDSRVFCAGFLKAPVVAILGAIHQQDYRFIFDVNNRVLEFAPEDCTRDSF